MKTTCHTFETPLGVLRLVGAERSIHRIDLPNRAAEPPDPAWTPSNGELPAALADAKRQLAQYFAGERREFDLPIEVESTDFERQVWAELERIPFGETVSYGEIAARIGKPAAVRAVGAANGRNPTPIVVPCHRVVGSDGRLVGYGGGLPTKRTLLDLERQAAGGLLRPVADSGPGRRTVASRPVASRQRW